MTGNEIVQLVLCSIGVLAVTAALVFAIYKYVGD